MNLLLLAAGEGKRFQDQGYDPKPLIKVDNLTMWQTVYINVKSQLPDYLNITPIIATKKEYNIEGYSGIVNLYGPQYGAAYSALEALDYYLDRLTLKEKETFYNDTLLIFNCDQLVYFDTEEFENFMYQDFDGGLFHFYEPNGENKWGRSEIDNGYIHNIVEKTPVTEHAHTGHYFFKRTKDFIYYAQKMIQKGIKVNGEYFLSPVYNLMIEDGKMIRPFYVDEFISLGIPEDLVKYQNREPG